MSDAWYSLDRYMIGCLAEKDKCGLNSEGQKILETIYRNYPTEVKKMMLLDFGKKNPKRFDLGHGTHRLAITGNNVQDDIFINQDLLNNKETGEALSQADIVAILIHELGHHTGAIDTEDRLLDKIGLAVS